MIWNKYQVDKNVLKVSQDLTLWNSEKGVVKINQGSLAVPIKQDAQRNGYIFHGEGKLILDTIVETEEGAIGKPIEEELQEPFLMLGDTEKIEDYLEKVSNEDLAKIGYKDEQEVTYKAKEFFEQFLGRKRVYRRNRGVIFAFYNKTGKFDILIAKDSKIVYKAEETVFISNRDKVVLKTPQKVILLKHKKCFVIA